MMQRCLIVILVASAFLIANARQSSAWVVFQPVRKGEVPSLIQNKELRAALSAVPPLGGTSTVGSWNQCTLYYRGTQKSLQALLDKLDLLDGVNPKVIVNQSGKLGRVESTKFNPLPRPLFFQFSVAVSSDLNPEKRAEMATIVVYQGGGIDPKKLRLPRPKAKYKVPVVPIELPAVALPKKTRVILD